MNQKDMKIVLIGNESPNDFFKDFCDELQGKRKCLLSMNDTFVSTKIALDALNYAKQFNL